METHYVRVKLPVSKKLETTIEALIYQAVPGDRLITLEDVYERTRAAAQKADERVPSRKSFKLLLESMVNRGLIKELYGLRLQRMLELV